MRTSVIVAKTERRGSFSSPASMALISWRISPAMRSWRCPATVIYHPSTRECGARRGPRQLFPGMAVQRVSRKHSGKTSTENRKSGFLVAGTPRNDSSLILAKTKQGGNCRGGILRWLRMNRTVEGLRLGPSEHFQIMVNEIAAEQIFGLGKNGLHRLLEVRGVIRKADDADLSALPGVVMVEFGDGHVKARAEAVFQTAQHLAFVLQGMRVRDENFQGQQADGHGAQLTYGRDNANTAERSFARIARSG